MKKIHSILKLRGGGGEGSSRLDELLEQAVKTQENGIKKSFSDQRDYRTFSLPNELDVLVVSDPKLEKAAAALTVNVGSYSDPPELPGLAHFLEHMLFMGTKKYPEENEYSSYLSQNGGYSNAYTASELTNYHFEVISGKLHGALDRFAQFFIEPLLLEDATDREIKAVDNECSGNQQNDMWRSFLIYRELAHDYHPIHKFNIGNLETLKHEPEKKGINTREALLSFYKQYYSANLMKLVVVGKESLDDLQGMVTELFSPVPNYEYKSPYVHPDPAGPAFDEKNLQKFINVVPVMDIRRIALTWILPKMTTENKLREAVSYLGSLIGDEGEGSILSYLKQKSWANGLSAGKYDDNYDLSTFGVTIYCTDLGISQHVNDIIEVVCNYINMLHERFKDKESCAYFFEENKIMSAIGYWFKSDSPPMSVATGLASKMQNDIDVKDILVTGHLNTRDSFEEVKQLLGELQPKNLLCFVSSQSFKDIADREETYFKTKFQVSDIPQELVDIMIGASEFEKLGLKITPPNKFIPSSFDVAPFEKPAISKLFKDCSPFLAKSGDKDTVFSHKALKHSQIKDKIGVVKDQVERSLLEAWEDDTFRRPVVIYSDETSTVWLKQDTTHKKPKSVFKVFLRNPAVNETLFAGFATSLFTQLLDETLNEETYSASSAGFYHFIGSGNNGVSMSFYGFAETLYKYVELISTKFYNFKDEKVEQSLFDRLKEDLMKNYKNVDKIRPVSLAMMNVTQTLTEKSVTFERSLAVLEKMTLQDVLEFGPRIFESMSVEILAMGNVRAKDAMEALNIIKKIFKPSRPVKEHHYLRTIDISGKGPVQHIYIEPARDPENPGSAMVAKYEFGERTDTKIALLNILSDVLREQFFNDLRTKQTLGYIVGSNLGVSNGILSLNFYVESNSADPVALNYKLEKFLDDFRKEYDTLFAPEKYQNIVNAEINGMLQRSTSVERETGRWWGRISGGLYNFENTNIVAQAIAGATSDELKQLLDEYLWGDSPKKAKFFSGMICDAHGKNLFGDEYVKLKPETVEGVKQGFSEEFILEWMERDPKLKKDFVEGRGSLNFITNLEAFKSSATYHISYKDILSKL